MHIFLVVSNLHTSHVKLNKEHSILPCPQSFCGECLHIEIEELSSIHRLPSASGVKCGDLKSRDTRFKLLGIYIHFSFFLGFIYISISSKCYFKLVHCGVVVTTKALNA